MAYEAYYYLYRDDVFICTLNWSTALTEEHLPTLAESGKVFLGWYTSDGYKYAVGDTVSPETNGASDTALYLYSKWEERDLTDWEPVYTITRETLLALGDAIRAKTGGTAYMTPEEMVAAIGYLKAPTMITFTISRESSVSYTAVEGMTWGEWCESAYNTLGLYVSPSSTHIITGEIVNKGYMEVRRSDLYPVASTDVIIAGHAYIIQNENTPF